MQQQLLERLDALKEEFKRGQEQLSQVEARAQTLRETLLRISGAIHVLEELASAAKDPPS